MRSLCEHNTKTTVLVIKNMTLISTYCVAVVSFVFFFQAEDGIRDLTVTGVQTCALPIWSALSAIFLRFGTLVKLGGAGAAAISGAVAVGVVGGPRDLQPAPVRRGPAPARSELAPARSELPSAASLRAHAAPVLSLQPARHRTISP